MKNLIGPILLLVGLLLFWLCGCATFEADIQGDNVHLKSMTLGKDIVIDPNGVMSTVSPKNQGIVEACVGFVAGFAAAGM